LQKILEAATDLFLKVGYEQTSIDAILLKSGGSKSTLYAYFPTKQDLFRSVIDSVVGEGAGGADSLACGPEVDSGGRCQPLGAPAVAGQLPAAPVIEGCDQLEQPLRVDLDPAGDGDDLLGQAIEGIELLGREAPDVGRGRGFMRLGGRGSDSGGEDHRGHLSQNEYA
jgi:hypothetical protein